MTQEDFRITLRLTFKGIQMPLRDIILILFQLLIKVKFLSKRKKKHEAT